MANINRTSADAQVPELWAQRGIDALRANIVLARIASKDTDYNIMGGGKLGDKVSIDLPPTFVANDKAANGAVTPQVPTDAVISVTINKHKEVTFILEDALRAVGKPGGLERYMAATMEPLANAVEADLFALYSGFSQSVGTSGTDVTRATFLAARKKLNDANIPEAGRAMVLSSKDETAVIGDTNLAPYFANSRPDVIERGAIAQLDGFDIHRSTLVPVVAGSPASTKNLAVTPEAMVLASRALPTDGNGRGAEQFVQVDPVSGLALRCTITYNGSQLGTQVTMDILYGVAEGRDAAGVVVLG